MLNNIKTLTPELRLTLNHHLTQIAQS